MIRVFIVWGDPFTSPPLGLPYVLADVTTDAIPEGYIAIAGDCSVAEGEKLWNEEDAQRRESRQHEQQIREKYPLLAEVLLGQKAVG